ncbi:hypothetical protein ABT381_20315 [Streptomyces sp. NPDC000151]|uniref:hypothetical protein n=1 Tax=Streptomyces sp. NPDC000151 TaxID=3154244 RepID=UPI00332CCD22
MPSPSGESIDTSDPKVKPSPGANASFVDNLVFELRKKTVGLAYAMGKTSGECDQKDAKPKAGTKLDCTVTYEGVKVPWSVKIKGEGITPNLVSYEAEPKKGIVTREGAIQFFWGNEVYGKKPKVHCTDIPKAAVVPLGKTKYQCEMAGGLRQNLSATTDGPRFY